MEGHIFVGILEDWLRGLTRRTGDEEKVDSTSLDASDSLLRPEELQRFKSWFSLALRITEVWSGGISLAPEDVVFSSAIRRTHTRLLKALSMFTDKELLDLFGLERANQIRGIANELALTSTSIGAVLIGSSADIA